VNRVFNMGATQDAIYADTQPLVRSVLDGARLLLQWRLWGPGTPRPASSAFGRGLGLDPHPNLAPPQPGLQPYPPPPKGTTCASLHTARRAAARRTP
jgi:hypothetical protein